MRDLQEFLGFLEKEHLLVRINQPISTQCEITEIHRRTLAKGGPALWFEKPLRPDGTISPIPLVTNLFGTHERVALGIGCQGKTRRTLADLRQLGHFLAQLRTPQPPKSMRAIFEMWPILRAAAQMRPRFVRHGAIDAHTIEGEDIDLPTLFPIQGCWPNEPAPLITWPLVVTHGQDMLNIGIYRMQCLDKRRTLMRWLAHRGGAQHYALWRQKWGNKPFPVAIVIGADPGTLLACVAPIPETLSEYHFAGLLRGQRLDLVSCTHDDQLKVPAHAEIVIEGFVLPEQKPEGPYGDHTGYYNSVEPFPVFEATKVRMRQNPVYLSTYTGRPPDEPSILGEALNEIFIPLLQQQFPEIIDFYLPPEGCSYRIAVVSIRKAYPGHAKRIMMGIWSFLRQFIYTKWVIIVDDDINIRDWKDVMWAISTRCDPVRDTTFIDNTPIDYLDFASPKEGLGGKCGIDATHKMTGSETDRAWGTLLSMNPETQQRIDALWQDLNL